MMKFLREKRVQNEQEQRKVPKKLVTVFVLRKMVALVKFTLTYLNSCSLVRVDNHPYTEPSVVEQLS